jgi:pectin methylesterase-like acyl-CoA thioesterase/sugar lactone lactonase YvrE
MDCTVPATVAPTAPGIENASLAVTPTGGSAEPVVLPISGSAAGAALVVDGTSATQTAIGSSLTLTGLATDGQGNFYTGNGKTLVRLTSSGTMSAIGTLSGAPSQIAVDAAGNVYAAGDGSGVLHEFVLGATGSYAETAVAFAPVDSATGAAVSNPVPQAVTADANGNLYIYDATSQAVYRQSTAEFGPMTTEIASGFSNVAALALDGWGNLYVADKGAGQVDKIENSATAATVATSASGWTVVGSGLTPVALVTDAGGDLYVADANSKSILEYSLGSAGAATTSASNTLSLTLSAPSGVAVDGLGNVYAADTTATALQELVRGTTSIDFGSNTSTVTALMMGNVGNAAATGLAQTDATDFTIAAGSSNGCGVSAASIFTPGELCSATAQFTPQATGSYSDTANFSPTGSQGSLALSGNLAGGSVVFTTTTIGSLTPASPAYVPNGAEVSFTITVAANSGSVKPTGSVTYSIDGGASVSANLTAGSVTVSLSGLEAGAHNITAHYAGAGNFQPSSTASAIGFTIQPIAPVLTWTPASNTQQVSAAIGPGVLNASVSPAVSGTFVYTATPAGGAAAGIDASSYLGIGTYSLAVTFYPSDAVDYATATGSVASYSVTKAGTTAVAGATQSLLAADGTGNYTTLAAALEALPANGGTIYIKPGAYSGQNAISYPNVSLRGLGGDPTKVVITGEDGAFSAPFVYPGSGPGNAGASGDQGSSILDVTKSAWIGQQATAGNVQYTPANFYAEYLTIQNTYNTDNYTTTTYNTSSGSCANSGSAQTLQALYNAGQQCNSQALALWIESDQAVLNNVNLTSQQDTLYAGSQGCGSSCVAARQYMWKGLITGDVDYVFGDAAMVFDHTNFFTTWHGASATGTETIEAQNKKAQAGSSNDYLSGYICNSCTLMSQSTGMTNLYYGRPYGPYSTWIMLNSSVDQVNPMGWIEFSNDNNLPTSTYAEYNTQSFTDPAPGTVPYPAGIFYEDSADIPGYTGSGYVITPTGGNTGAGVAGTRETVSQDPGTLENGNTVKTELTAGQAAQYYPVTFLSSTVPTQNYPGFTANWNPVTALAAAINNFANTGNLVVSAVGQSVTILGRPQTPGAGIIPTGTYTFYDGSTQLAAGNLDASGEAYFTTNALAAGRHSITMVYGGDSNFSGSTSAPVIISVGEAISTTTLSVTSSSSIYGGAVAGNVTVAPQTGSGTPTGSVTLFAGTASVGSCTLTAGACSFKLTGIPAGATSLTAQYQGDATFAASASVGVTINVARAVLQVTATSYTINVGAALPTYAATITGFVNGDTQATAVTGAPMLSSAVTSSSLPGEYAITASIGTLAAANYDFTFSSGYLRILPASGATAVATGDSRAVTEPTFPSVCQQLTAAIAMVNNDIPASVDATVTNPDGARIQAALNACSGTGQAVELSMDGSGNNAFLSGPLSMPSNVTLLVDPGVVLFFSRNAQDYDKVQGTHTCGNISTLSATSACLPLIDIPGTSTGVSIMGYGKLDGRGGDPLINAVAPYQGYSWWGLSAAYSSPNGQDNPRFVQMESGASNITLYKITLRNSPLFHVSTTGAVSNVTIWDVKVVTPTSSRNTDGIDPGNVTNWTVTRSWVSDGDDNIAVGASGSNPASNVSITNNHFFAGHGESIGSITEAGVSNVLFDGNMSAGNGFAGVGSSVSAAGTFAGGVSDSNSTAIRIKSANDRGGVVTNIQYSNSCFLDHKSDVQFTPLYNTNSGTLTPNFNNILMQNLVFLNDASSAGGLQFTGAVNGATINPLVVTLDNVTFPGAVSSSTFTTTGSAGTETNAQLTYGPGQVSSNFISAWATFAGSNGDTVTNNITASSLQPPAYNFTYIAPELTGPMGLPQTITEGQNATAVMILTPAVGGAAYPTGTVTLTDALTGSTYSATLPGDTDTIFIPLSGLTVGTHTFTATYSGDSNYAPPSGAAYYTSSGPYTITVNAGSLGSSSTTISLGAASGAYGTPVTATATVTGSNPTGTVQFVVSGGGLAGSYTYATVALTAAGSSTATASTNLNLPMSATAYSVVAIYSGDSANSGSTSAGSTLTVGAALTTTALSVNPTTVTLGTPALVTVTVSSAGGVATGTVSLSYTTAANNTPVLLGSVTLTNGSASFSAELPAGSDSLTASYAGAGSFAASSSAPMTVTVNAYTPIALPARPMALANTMTTLVGGAGSNCAAATDQYGDGCLGTAIALAAGDDLRGIATDPFGNVYFTDISAALIRRVSPNGVVANFAGRVTGTACSAPPSTAANGTGCVPTLVSLKKPRGVSSDAAGNIFIADYSGNKVYEVRAADGLMYTVAGTGTGTSTGDGGQAVAATVYSPRSAWGDSLGNIYIADTSGNRIRVVDTAGYIHAFAGTGTAGSTGDGGPALAAEIGNPQGVMVDNNLNVYIADSASVRVVCVTCGANSPLDSLLGKLGVASPVNGDIYTIAGGGATTAANALQPVSATSVTMQPQKLGIDRNGNIYISDGYGAIWFLDAQSGSIRALAASATTVCTGSTDSVGDGCQATQASFGDAGNGIGVAVDPLGNVYIGDTLNLRIRKAATNLATAGGAIGTAIKQEVELHFIPGDSLATTNGLVSSSGEWSLSTPSCTTNADASTDCTFTSSFTPAIPGARSTPLTVTSSKGNIANLALTGMGLGAGATVDPASQTSFGAGLAVAGLATDHAGNIYVSDSNSKQLFRFNPKSASQGSSATGTTLATLGAPGAIALDSRGYVYVADTAAGTITRISPAGGAVALPYTFTKPAGLAVDSVNNLYVSDSATKAVYLINPATGAKTTLAMGTLVAPSGLAVDPSGNLLVADPGAPAVYRFNLLTGTRTTVTTPATAPSQIVTDAAGNLLIADASAILAVPASSNSSAFTVAGIAPAALAIDSAGNLYTGSSGGVLKLARTQGAIQFAAAGTSQTAYLLASGNQTYTATTWTQTDTTDYGLAPTASTDCALNSTGAGTLSSGGLCALIATYPTATTAATTDAVTFNGNLTNAALSTPSAVQLTLTGQPAIPPPAPGVPAISAISPGFVSAGAAAFTLTVNGSGFVSGSTIEWGSTALTTTFVSSTELTAQVPSSAVSTAGINAITVQTPAPGGGTSNAMQFEVDSPGSGGGPVFTTLTATVTPGSTVTYALTLPAGAANVSVQCLNLPAGAACSYSSTSSTLTISTTSSTPSGTYQITVVITETLPGSATALIFLPFLLLPLAAFRTRWARQRVWLTIVLTIAVAAGATMMGCGGSAQTHTVTRSATVTLVVK